MTTQTTLKMKHGDNPADHSVADVKAYWEVADAAERDRILTAEAEGQNRTTIAALANTPAANPDAAAAQQSRPSSSSSTSAAAGDGETKTVTLSTKKVLQAINAEDPDDADPDTVKALQDAFYQFGSQDPSLELPRSWQRVQRRIKLEDGEQPDGVATAEQVQKFAAKAGLELTK